MIRCECLRMRGGGRKLRKMGGDVTYLIEGINIKSRIVKRKKEHISSVDNSLFIWNRRTCVSTKGLFLL